MGDAPRGGPRCCDERRHESLGQVDGIVRRSRRGFSAEGATSKKPRASEGPVAARNAALGKTQKISTSARKAVIPECVWRKAPARGCLSPYAFRNDCLTSADGPIVQFL